MAMYTYDEEADALYVLLASDPEPAVHRTVEVSDRLHVDLDEAGGLVGVEILYPTLGEVDLAQLRDRFGLDLRLPFRFAA
ncbi:MAG: DUF2283 domain-containing protein [Actinomycetota bacterium]